MGISLGSSFDRTSAVPLDSSSQVANVTARDAIAAGVRWEGMIVHCLAEKTSYELKTGVTNSDWVAVGSGTGGVQNYISNGTAELNTAGFATYLNVTAPTNRPNPTVTLTTTVLAITTSATAPLSGTKSFLLTKGLATGNQGEAVYYDFTIDAKDKARMQQISFDYLVDSGVFNAATSSTDSDIVIGIIDLTNGKYIEPSDIQLRSNSTTLADKFSATFQAAGNSVSYRLCFHQAGSGTNVYALKVDNISVAPSQYVFAPTVSAWTPFTPVISPISGYTLAPTGFFRTVGDTREYTISFRKDGSTGVGAGNLLFTLPNGDTVDTAKANNNSGTYIAGVASTYGVIGASQWDDALPVVISSSTQMAVANPGLANVYVGTNVTASSYWNLKFALPILGLTSTTQISDGYDAKPIVFSAFTSSQALTAGVTNLQASAIGRDTALMYSAGTLTIKSAGDYILFFSGSISASPMAMQCFINNVGGPYLAPMLTGSNNIAVGSLFLDGMKAGDTVQLRSSATLTVSSASWALRKDMSSSTMSRGAKIGAGFSSAIARTINNTAPIIIYEIVNYDYTGSYNPTTGEYKVPSAGLYDINGYFRTTAVATVASFATLLRVYVNNVHIKTFAGTRADSASAITRESGGATSIMLLAGDVVTFRIYADTANTTGASVADSNWITINKAD